MSARSWSWGRLGLAGLAAFVTVAAADIGLGRFAPPVRQREVEDALADLELERPAVLVLGSSHARTFDEVARIAGGERRTAPELVAVPLEYGRLAGYRWVLERRIQPLLEPGAVAGDARRAALRHLVVVTEWWDSLPTVGRFEPNIPSRAFTWADFGADLWGHGLDDLNRNFLQERWRRLFDDSALVQDRGTQRIYLAILDALRGRPDASAAASREAQRLSEWRSMIEGGDAAMLAPDQVDALRAILAFARERGIRSTVLLYPRKPATLTQRARESTLARFSAAMRELARDYGAAFQDDTEFGFLTDAHFEADFDHLTRAGHEIYARHLLDTVLAGTGEGSEGAGR